MPAWALRVFAVALSGLAMLGSSTYVLANPYNPEAPLHPPVVKEPEAVVHPNADPNAVTVADPDRGADAIGKRSRESHGDVRADGAHAESDATAHAAPDLRTNVRGQNDRRAQGDDDA